MIEEEIDKEALFKTVKLMHPNATNGELEILIKNSKFTTKTLKEFVRYSNNLKRGSFQINLATTFICTLLKTFPPCMREIILSDVIQVLKNPKTIESMETMRELYKRLREEKNAASENPF